MYSVNQETQQTQALLAIPRQKRGDAWHDQFFAVVPNAGFMIDPNVMIGPDGFAYMQLFSPLPGQVFEAHSIRSLMSDFLIREGVGVVINPHNPEGPDMVFSYGDIVNLYLRDEFYSPSDMFETERRDTVIPAGTVIDTGAPSAEHILPPETRTVLRRFMNQQGFNSPKIALYASVQQDGRYVQELALNVSKEYDFDSDERFNQFMSTLGWFLPRHYAIACIDAANLLKMEPL